MIVRLAHLKDVPWISQLWAEEMPSFWSDAMIRESFCADGSLSLVAATGEECTGFIMGSHKGTPEIYGIATQPSYQRQGIGSLLLGAFLECLRQKSVDSVFLEVAETNESARRLYEKHGFYLIGKRPHYYKDITALVLKKEIKKEPSEEGPLTEG